MNNRNDTIDDIDVNRSESGDSIDDGDEGFEDDCWKHTVRKEGHAVTYPMHADRWWNTAGAWDEEGDEEGQCLGIRCNISARAKVGAQSHTLFEEGAATT